MSICNKQNNDALNDYNNFLIDLLNQGEISDFLKTSMWNLLLIQIC